MVPIESVLNAALSALAQRAELDAQSVVVLGASTSEIVGGDIGKAGVPELGKQVAQAFIAACRSVGVQPAFQCCEHLNRAIVLEKGILRARGLTQVMAVPKPTAGGSVAAAAWLLMDTPALAAHIQAEAAVDIGDTLVGMHIRPVAVPLRIDHRRLGEANLVLAYARLPLIGGERAQYA